MNNSTDFLEAALRWYRFGVQVIPVVGKQTVEKWDLWLQGLSPGSITIHWTMNPNHELGFILGAGIIVFDADTHEAVAALTQLEWAHGIEPNLVVKTTRGEHHYFRKPKGVYAKTSGHGADRPDQQIDIKVGRTMVVLPPSTGKEILISEAESVDDLVEVTQELVDAVCLHKGQPVPRPVTNSPSPCLRVQPQSEDLGKVRALLQHIDPDCGYGDWITGLMAIYYESHGSDEGLELAIDWSSKGKSYKDVQEVKDKWESFNLYVANPVTIATLIKRVKDNGVNLEDVWDAAEPQFEICQTTVIPELAAKTENANVQGTVFDKFSLTGMSEELEKNALEQVPVLGAKSGVHWTPIPVLTGHRFRN